MYSLLRRFRNNQKHSLDFLEQMQVTVRQDIAPSDDLVKNLMYALSDLQKVYQEIRILSGVESDGLPVTEYESAWNDSRKNRAPLETFLRVSCVPNKPWALEALREAQERAETLLQNRQVQQTDAALYAEFVDCVQNGSITNEHLDRMEQRGFSGILSAGLLRGCYYIPGSSQGNLGLKTVPESSSTELSAGETAEDSASIPEAVGYPEPRTEEKEGKSPPDRTVEDSADREVEHVTEELLTAQNADNLRGIGKVNAKAFISEIKKYRPLSRVVMMLVSYIGVMEETAVAMILQHSFPTISNSVQSDVSQAMELLSQNGVLAHYILPDSGRSVYALSEYTAAVQTKSKVKDYLMKNSPVRLSGRLRGFGKTCGLEKLQVELTISDAIVSYMSWIYRVIPPEEYDKFTAHMKWTKEERMTVDVLVSGEVAHCMLVPAEHPPVSMPETAVLLYADEKPDWMYAWTDLPGNVFLLQAETLFCWNADTGWDAVLPEPNCPTEEETGEPERTEAENATETGDEDVTEPEAEDATVPETKSTGAKVTDSPVSAITSGERSKLETQSAGTDAEKPDLGEVSAPEEDSDLENMPESFIQGVPELAAHETAKEILDAFNSGGELSDEKIVSLVETLLAQDREQSLPGNQSKIVQGLILAAACYHDPAGRHRFPKTAWLYRRLRPALHLPMDDSPYTQEMLDRYPESNGEAVQAMLLATAVHASLFSSIHIADFYAVRSTLDNLNADYDARFSEWKELRPLFHTLSEVRREVPQGIREQDIIQAMGGKDRDKRAEHLAAKAKNLLITPQMNIRFNGINAFLGKKLGEHSKMRKCLEYVCRPEKPDKEQLEDVREYLRNFCGDRVDQGCWEVDSELLYRLIYDGVNAERTSTVSKVDYQARNKVEKEFRVRTSVLAEWLDLYLTRETQNERMGPLLEKIRRDLSQAKEVLLTRAPSAWRNILIASVDCALARLRMQNLNACYTELLHTGLIPLDAQWIPILERRLYDVEYSQPWYLMLEHIQSNVQSFDEALEEIGRFDGSDNCIQRNQIERLLQRPVTELDKQEIQDMERRVEQAERDVRDHLEEASVFGRMDDDERELMMNTIDAMKPILLAENENGYRDFGRWRHFLLALQTNMKQGEERQRLRMESLLNECRAQQDAQEPDELLREMERLIEEKNYAVAEEYINLFRQGKREIPDLFRTSTEAMDYFDHFMEPQFYERILSYCKRSDNASRNLGALGRDWKRQTPDFIRNLNHTLTTRDYNSASELLSRWPIRRGQPVVFDIMELLKCLGISVSDGKKRPETSMADVFDFHLNPKPRNQESYEHPIKQFGTSPDSNLVIICLYGSRPAPALLSDARKCAQSNITTIVLLDYSLDSSTRRQLAQQIRENPIGSHSPLLVIDRVLMIYLATLNENERLRALLACALPFAICQPFNGDKGSTADEMFAGRIRELDEIRQHNGACVVYGGRQLGKTALLKRAESLEHDPKQRSFAVYADLRDSQDEGAAVAEIVQQIRAKLKGSDVEFRDVADMKGLCSQILQLMNDGAINKFLLLLDEVDKFLATDAAQEFKATWPLEKLWKEQSGGKFKFVMAGLHNVCRTVKKRKDTDSNDVPFGQMGIPLCIRPLSVADAQMLLMRPLRCLGFRIKNETVLKAILTSTCYYPGIIQFFGHQLVEAVNGNYTRYYRAESGSPPFFLEREQLGAVMNSNELTDSIRHKINLTLELDARYKLLACCIAYYYMEDVAYAVRGCSLEEIRAVADLCDMESLCGLSNADLLNLLEELEQMGILVSSEENHRFRFRRNTFKNVVGTNAEVLEENIRVLNESRR